MTTLTPLPIHAVIISWTQHEADAMRIARCLEGHVDQLTVIYSNNADQDRSGSGDWIRVPNDWFYGKKFKRSLEAHRQGVMLQIQADASSDDWAGLVKRCRIAFAKYRRLGVWAPDVDFTHWPARFTNTLRLGAGLEYLSVQTDGIAWAIAPALVDRLRLFDFEANNIGWGIDWASIACAYVNNFMVIRDMSFKVFHPSSRGYSSADALRQMQKFFEQFTLQERTMLHLLTQHVEHRKRLAAGLTSKSGSA